MRFTYYCTLFVVAFLISSCQTEPKDAISAATIAGKWTIIAAKRDSFPTAMLNGAYIDIKTDQLVTSLPLLDTTDASSSPFTMFGDSMSCPNLQTYFKFKKRHDTLDATFTNLGFLFTVNMLKQ